MYMRSFALVAEYVKTDIGSHKERRQLAEVRSYIRKYGGVG